MKNRKVLEMSSLFEDIIKKKYKGINFGFFILKNKKVVDAYVETVKELDKPVDGFSDFEDARIAVLQECSTDENNTVQTRDIGNGRIEYLIQDYKKDLFTEKFEQLKTDFDEVIKAEENRMSEFMNLLDKESDIVLSQIDKNDLPTDISIDDLEAIFELVKE